MTLIADHSGCSTGMQVTVNIGSSLSRNGVRLSDSAGLTTSFFMNPMTSRLLWGSSRVFHPGCAFIERLPNASVNGRMSVFLIFL